MRHVCLLAGWLTDWMGECLMSKGRNKWMKGWTITFATPEWDEEPYYNFDTYKLDIYIFIYSFWLRWVFLGLPRWCSGKESACQCRRHKRCGFNNLGQEDPLEEDRVTHSNILAWRIPWTEELLTARLLCPWGHESDMTKRLSMHTHDMRSGDTPTRWKWPWIMRLSLSEGLGVSLLKHKPLQFAEAAA